MESSNTLYCPKCNDKFAEAFMLPCMHNFCSKCKNLMNDGSETTCFICSNSCHQDEIKRNLFLEKLCYIESQNNKIIICELCDSDNAERKADKYCVDCLQYICLKCLKIHLKSKQCMDHKIVDKSNVENLIIKSLEPICEIHKTKFTIYCRTCDSLMCATCCSLDLLHTNHHKSDNLREVIDKSNFDIKKKIIEIDDIIKSQNQLIESNTISEKKIFEKYDNIQNEIENYAKELKDLIDNLTKVNVDKIIAFKNNYDNSVKANLKKISDNVVSLTNLKSYFQEVINKGSTVDLFELKKELNKNPWIETKKPKCIPIINFFFQKPTINTLITNKLSGSLKSDETKDLEIILKKSTISPCVFKQNINTLNYKDNCIDMYDRETGNYQSSIEYKQYLRKDTHNHVFIINTLNELFLYYRYANHCTYILKLNDNKSFVEIKKLEYKCKITTTFQQTLLVKTESNILIELSADGNELKRIKIPTAAFLSSLFSLSNCNAYQLKDGRYIVASSNVSSFLIKGKNLAKISLLDSQGNFIKSFPQTTTIDYITCTDGEKFIFCFIKNSIGTITVLSTDLKFLLKFDYPKIKDLYFDHDNDKLLVLKNKKIIYITYRFAMQVPI